MSMRMLLSFAGLIGLLLPGVAQAQTSLRITSDVADSEIVLKGAWGNRSSAAPLVVPDLEAGRYDVEVYRAGRRMGAARLDYRGSLRLVGRGGSRAILSAMLPGLGQWRDHGFDEGLIPFMTVGTGVGFWLDALSQATRDRESRDNFETLTPAQRGLTQAEYDQEVANLQGQINLSERSRDRYLGLAVYLHVGNILDAAVRRGLYRFDLSGASSVAARYRPPNRATVAIMSTVWPGLGQTHMGHASRGQFWAIATTAAGILVMDRQRRIDEDRAEVDRLEGLALLEAAGGGGASANTLLDLDEARSDLEGSRLWRDVLIGGAVGLWVLNLTDALFLTSHAPVPAAEQASGPRLGLKMAWLQGSPALGLGGSF